MKYEHDRVSKASWFCAYHFAICVFLSVAYLAESARADFYVIGGGRRGSTPSGYAEGGGFTPAPQATASGSIAMGVAATASGSNSVVSGGRSNGALGNHSTVGGGRYNVANNESATVSGGQDNSAQGEASTIAGGRLNMTEKAYSTVGGGYENEACQTNSTVGGGRLNEAHGVSSTVSGGEENTASTNFSTVAGGQGNQALGIASTVGGGQYNTARGAYSMIGGGRQNLLLDICSVIGGGESNYISGTRSSILGGLYNTVNGTYAFIGGGSGNYINATYALVAGGLDNCARGYATSVGGGETNRVEGDYATIPGGYGNFATDAAFAAGYRAKATHSGSFVWADYLPAADFASTTFNQFAVRARGGAYFRTQSSGLNPAAFRIECTSPSGVGLFITQTSADANLVTSNPGSGEHIKSYSGVGGGTLVFRVANNGAVTAQSFTPSSDRNLKEDFEPIDASDILDKVAALPITSWRFKSDESAVRHIGPMAQDFHAAFGVGENDTGIATVDADGVALAAIQALYEENQALKTRIERLEAALLGLSGK